MVYLGEKCGDVEDSGNTSATSGSGDCHFLPTIFYSHFMD